MATTTRNKRKKAVAATVAAAAILLAGTFAWTSISQQAKNEAIVDINPGGRLHDDFNGTNKDVYVENFGDDQSGVPIYARIRLDQYMEIGPDAGLNLSDEMNTRNVKTLIGTDADAYDTWKTYKPGDAIKDGTLQALDHWEWKLGRTEEETLPLYMPTFNKNKDSLEADRNGTYQGVTPNDIVHYDDYVDYSVVREKTDTEVYDWDSDTNEEPRLYAYDNGEVTTDPDTPIDNADVYHIDGVKHESKQISTGSTVITMKQWINEYNCQPGPYWVYDEDGWAYWANPIMPGQTTGLFLDGINMNKTPDENWYYGINVVAQFATEGDLTAFAADGYTDNAQRLMELATADGTVVSTAEALRYALAEGKDVVLAKAITTTAVENPYDLNFDYNLLMTEGTLSGEKLNLEGSSVSGLFLNSENDWPKKGDKASPITVKDIAITTPNTRVGVHSQAINGPIKLDNVEITSTNTGIYAEFGTNTTTLNNVTIKSTGPDKIEGYDWLNAAVAAANGANVVINGGTYSGANAVYIFSTGGTVTINDGYFDGALTVDKGSLIINGGTFKADPSDYVDKDVYEVVQNDDGTYTVQEPALVGDFAVVFDESAAIIGSTDTTDETGIGIKLQDDGSDVSEDVTWEVSSQNAVVENGHIKASQTATMGDAIEKYTVTASIKGKQAATAEVYMYDATRHVINGREHSVIKIEGSGNIYCLLNPAVSSYIIVEEVVGCVWKYGDSTDNIYQYTHTMNVDYPGLVAAIEDVIYNGETRDKFAHSKCPHLNK